jgi:hypothetical protein
MRSFTASLRVKPDQPEIERWLADALIPGGLDAGGARERST